MSLAQQRFLHLNLLDDVVDLGSEFAADGLVDLNHHPADFIKPRDVLASADVDEELEVGHGKLFV